MKFYIFLVLILLLQADFVDDLIDRLEARAEEKLAGKNNAVPKQTLMDMVDFEVVGDGFCRDANGNELKLLMRPENDKRRFLGQDDVVGKNGPCALLCANYKACTGIAVGRVRSRSGWGDTVEGTSWSYTCYAYGDFKHTPRGLTLKAGSIAQPAQGGGSGEGQDAKCKRIIRHPIRAPIKASCSSGQEVKRMANGDESCVTKGSIDWNTASCNILRGSPNGRRFKYGCQGAVWSSGNPSEEYCRDKAWFNRCCEWNMFGIQDNQEDVCIQKIDCQVWPTRSFWNNVEPKLAPEMGPCSWAVASDGIMSRNYCEGRKDDGVWSFVHPWFGVCCRGGSHDGIMTFYGNKRIEYCMNNKVWPRKEGVTYYEH